MIETYSTEQSRVVVFWQDPSDDEHIVEPAMSMKAYSDCLSITQGKGRAITITLSCVPEFIKAVKKAMEVE